MVSALAQLEREMSKSRAAHDKLTSPEPPKHASSKGKCLKLDQPKPAISRSDPRVAVPDISKLLMRKPAVATPAPPRDSEYSLPHESVTHAQRHFEAKTGEAGVISGDNDSNLLNTVIDPGHDSELKLIRLKQSDRFGCTYEAEQVATATLLEVRVYSYAKKSSAEKKSARRNCRSWKVRRRFQYSHYANGLVFLILRYPGRQPGMDISSSSTIAPSAASFLDVLPTSQDSPFNLGKQSSTYVDAQMKGELRFYASVPDAKDCTSSLYYTMPITGKTISRQNEAILQGVSFFNSRQPEKSKRQKERARLFQRQKRQIKTAAAARSTSEDHKPQPPTTPSPQHLSSRKRMRYVWDSEWYHSSHTGWLRNLILLDRDVQRPAYCYGISPYAPITTMTTTAKSSVNANEKPPPPAADAQAATSFNVYSDPLVIQKILGFLFSDDNLSVDTALRQYMASDGFVDVAALAMLKKLRRFDIAVIRAACREDLRGIEYHERHGFGRVRRAEGWENWVLPVWERHPLVKDVRGPAAVRTVGD